MRKTIIPLLVWAIVIGAVLGLIAPKVGAEPLYQAKGDDGTVIVLHSEACALKEVSNLTKRATWHEGGQDLRGLLRLASAIPGGGVLLR